MSKKKKLDDGVEFDIEELLNVLQDYEEAKKNNEMTLLKDGKAGPNLEINTSPSKKKKHKEKHIKKDNMVGKKDKLKTKKDKSKKKGELLAPGKDLKKDKKKHKNKKLKTHKEIKETGKVEQSQETVFNCVTSSVQETLGRKLKVSSVSNLLKVKKKQKSDSDITFGDSQEPLNVTKETVFDGVEDSYINDEITSSQNEQVVSSSEVKISPSKKKKPKEKHGKKDKLKIRKDTSKKIGKLVASGEVLKKDKKKNKTQKDKNVKKSNKLKKVEPSQETGVTSSIQKTTDKEVEVSSLASTVEMSKEKQLQDFEEVKKNSEMTLQDGKVAPNLEIKTSPSKKKPNEKHIKKGDWGEQKDSQETLNVIQETVFNGDKESSINNEIIPSQNKEVVSNSEGKANPSKKKKHKEKHGKKDKLSRKKDKLKSRKELSKKYGTLVASGKVLKKDKKKHKNQKDKKVKKYKK